MRTAFHHIAYQPLDICNALSWSSLEAALRQAGLQAGRRLLDIGCGYGQASIRVAQSFDAVAVTAVEMDPVMAEGARSRIAQAGLEPRIRLRREPSVRTLEASAPFDVILALGTTQPAGPGLREPRDVFAALGQHLVPGGALVWGDLTWTAEPSEPLRMLVESGGYYVDHQAWQAAARAAGLEVLSARLSDATEWGPYRQGMDQAVNGWLDDHPDHPDAAAVASSAQRVRMIFDFGADCLGFGLYVFRRPD